jgi:cation diffusion facilitator family transporter
MTDVWTSVGVLVGVGSVQITGWLRLDAIVAMAVGLNIVITGMNLLRESTSKLMDQALPEDDHKAIVDVLKKFESAEVKFHALQTRESGRHRFVSMHVLVPGAWTVQKGHDLSEDLEQQIIAVLPDTTVSTHVEPIEDPRAWEDIPAGSHTWE